MPCLAGFFGGRKLNKKINSSFFVFSFHIFKYGTPHFIGDEADCAVSFFLVFYLVKFTLISLLKFNAGDENGFFICLEITIFLQVQSFSHGTKSKCHLSTTFISRLSWTAVPVGHTLVYVCVVIPLPGDQIDVVSQGSVVFGQLFRRSILSWVLGFGGVGISQCSQTDQHTQH